MKNKTLIALSMLTTMILPLSVKAGTEMHGGDSVVCFQNLAQKQKVETILRQNKLASQMGYIRQDPFSDINMDDVTVETLDVWEVRHTTNSSREFVNVDDVNAGVKDRIAAMNNKVKYIAGKIQAAQDSFYNPSKWLASATGIVEIDDSHELINYTNLCIPVQLAVQTDTRVYYDKRLYSKLDEMNKTALVLHELLYSWVKNFSNSSLNVRKYVGLLMLKEFDTYSAEELVNEMSVDFKNNPEAYARPYIVSNECQATSQQVEGLNLKVSYSLRGLNSSICEAKNIDYVGFTIDENDLKLLANKTGHSLSGGSYGELREGVLTLTHLQLTPYQEYTVPTVTPFKISSTSLSLPVKDGKVLPLYPDRFESMTILDQKMSIGPNWIEYRKTTSGKLYLYQVQLEIREDVKLKAASKLKSTKKCDDDDFVHFNADGLVISCQRTSDGS